MGEDNKILETKLDSLRELIELRFKQNDKDHEVLTGKLGRMTGEVEKNSKWRTEGKIYIGIVGFLVATATSIVIKLLT